MNYKQQSLVSGGMLPYHTQLIDAFYGKFIIEDWHNFGYSYYRQVPHTCMIYNFIKCIMINEFKMIL